LLAQLNAENAYEVVGVRISEVSAVSRNFVGNPAATGHSLAEY
jgi:hypothetical protein